MSDKSSNDLMNAVKKLKRENTKENLDILMETLKKSIVYIPAAMPEDISPEMFSKIASEPGVERNLPDGVIPRLQMIKNEQGDTFLPGFVTRSMIMKDKQHKDLAPLILGMPFENCIKMITENDELDGFVLNPYTENIVLNIKQKKQEKEIKLTKEQFDVFIRQQLESNVLPKALYDNEKFFADLMEDAEGTILKIYESVYKVKSDCPYKKSDFDHMLLNIREDLSILRIEMPEKNNIIATASNVYIVWNPTNGKKAYLAFVKDKDESRIMRVYEDERKEDIQKAPEDGSDFNTIIEMFTKN